MRTVEGKRNALTMFCVTYALYACVIHILRIRMSDICILTKFSCSGVLAMDIKKYMTGNFSSHTGLRSIWLVIADLMLKAFLFQ